MYRKKTWAAAERDHMKKQKKENWFKPHNEESVIFIPATARSELKKRFDRALKLRDLNIRVVEKNGMSLKGMFQQPIPTRKSGCKCIACQSGVQNGQCRRENIVYELQCDNCSDRYIGETSRNIYTRLREHLRDARVGSKDSVLLRHKKDKHSTENTTPTFRAKVLKSFRKGALQRQIAESVYINRVPETTLINNKLEWNSNVLHEGPGNKTQPPPSSY